MAAKRKIWKTLPYPITHACKESDLQFFAKSGEGVVDELLRSFLLVGD